MRRERPRVHLVSGPSSSGKSGFIGACRDRYEAVLFPNMLRKTPLVPGKAYLLHYNILWPFENLIRLRSSRSISRRLRGWILAARMRRRNPYRTDGRIWGLRRRGLALEATVLVVSREELLRRVASRRDDEPLKEGGKVYSREKWTGILGEVDLARVYAEWLEILEEMGVKYELRRSEGGEYPLLEAGALQGELARSVK